jgi:hypothetical protein
MIEASVRLNISGERGDDCLSSWDKPFEDGGFQRFGIIASCTRGPFTQLLDDECDATPIHY